MWALGKKWSQGLIKKLEDCVAFLKAINPGKPAAEGTVGLGGIGGFGQPAQAPLTTEELVAHVASLQETNTLSFSKQFIISLGRRVLDARFNDAAITAPMPAAIEGAAPAPAVLVSIKADAARLWVAGFDPRPTTRFCLALCSMCGPSKILQRASRNYSGTGSFRACDPRIKDK